MPITPDVHSELEKHGLVLVSLGIEPRAWAPETAEETGPSTHEVLDYFRARKILATVGAGADFGSPFAVVVNIAVYLDADSGELTIAVKTDNGKIAPTQTFEIFIEGMAHTLRTAITADDEARFNPHVTPDNPETEDYIPLGLNASSISIVEGALPKTAYRMCIESPEDISYALCDNKQIIAGTFGMISTPVVNDRFTDEYPWLTFAKLGKVRQVSLIIDSSLEDALILTCSPPYLPAVEVMPETLAHSVMDAISQPIRIAALEELPKRPEQLRTARNQESRARGFKIYDRLLSEADSLTFGQPSELFARVSQLAGYSEELTAIISAHEARTETTLPKQLASTPFTHVHSQTSLGFSQKVSLGSALEAQLDSASKASAPRSNWFTRFRNSRACVLAVGIFQLVCTAIIGGLSATAFIEKDMPFGIVLAVLAAFLLFVPITALGAASQYRRAQEMLNRAHSDGVLPFEVS